MKNEIKRRQVANEAGDRRWSRLRVGELAPGLVGESHTGAPVSLTGLRGRPVLVSFFRYASCPLCNLRVHELRRAFPDLAGEGLAIIAIFQSSPAVIADYVGRQEVPFPLLGDPTMIHYRGWGVETGWWGMLLAAGTALRAFRQGYWPGRIDGPVHRLPADFLVGADGRLQEVLYARHQGEHLSLERIRACLAATGRPTLSAHAS